MALSQRKQILSFISLALLSFCQSPIALACDEPPACRSSSVIFAELPPATPSKPAGLGIVFGLRATSEPVQSELKISLPQEALCHYVSEAMKLSDIPQRTRYLKAKIFKNPLVKVPFTFGEETRAGIPFVDITVGSPKGDIHMSFAKMKHPNAPETCEYILFTSSSPYQKPPKAKEKDEAQSTDGKKAENRDKPASLEVPADSAVSSEGVITIPGSKASGATK